MAAKAKYNPDYHDNWAWSLAAMGATNEQIAEAFGVSARTIIRWVKEHESFEKSINEGKHISDAKVIRSLYERAVGFEYTETKKIVEMSQSEESSRFKLKPLLNEPCQMLEPPPSG